MINLYRSEYERQHPKRRLNVLRIISIIIAALIVLAAGVLKTEAAALSPARTGAAADCVSSGQEECRHGR